MSLIDKILPKRSKRMKIALLTMAVNFSIFILGIFKGADLSGLGTGLALVNAPILTFIIGDSLRKSEEIIVEEEIKKDVEQV